MNDPHSSEGPVLTLEPFLEAVREGLEGEGWELSGLQKTTSYEFEGRWAGDSSRSAYLFFHRPELGDWTSIDVFLDETTQGLKGNLALVLDGPALSGIPDPGDALKRLGGLAREALPKGYRTPLTLRYRLSGPEKDPGDADSEVRFKLYFPRKVIQSGSRAISDLAKSSSRALLEILQAPGLKSFLPSAEGEDDEGL
jgi:hypothetical protein